MEFKEKIKFDLLYEGAIKPKIGTKGSAGYDISIPLTYIEDIVIKPGETVKINSGVAACMPRGIVLLLFVRSSIGIKRGLVLTNGTGVIDSDYYGNPTNKGEIIIALKNTSNNEVVLKPGERVIQGVFVPYFLTAEDEAELEKDTAIYKERQGGIGSTNKE